MRSLKNYSPLLLSLSTLSASIMSPHVVAGGLWLNEYGSPAMGRANAGAEAGETDASASLHNPASMSRIDGEQVMVTGGLIYSDVKFEIERSSLANGTNNGGQAGSTAPTASAFYTKKIDDTWAVGVSAAAITGAEIDYNNQWAGRYQATFVSIVGLAVMPAVSYKLNDKVSFGFGLPIMYTELELEVAVPNLATPITGPDGSAEIDGDDIVVGFNLSTQIELDEHTSVGFVYHSEMEPEYSGDGKVSAVANAQTVAIDTELTLAARFYGGIKHQLNQDVNVYASLGWEDWSAMENVNLSTSSGGSALKKNWVDTYHYAVGMNWQLDEHWLLETGIAYDTNPTDAENRTADMPLDRQVRYAFGTQYKNKKGPSIGAQIVFADFGNGRINSSGLGPGSGPGVADGFAGKYKNNNIIFFSVNANWVLGE